VETDLGAVELSSLPPSGGDADATVACQGVLYPLIHQQSPIEMTRLWCRGQAMLDLVYSVVDRHGGGVVEARHPQHSMKGHGLFG
jgi:hypothetical protein